MNSLERYTMGFIGVVFAPFVFVAVMVATVGMLVSRLGPLVTDIGYALFATLVVVVYAVVFWVAGVFLVLPLVRESWAILTKQGPWK